MGYTTSTFIVFHVVRLYNLVGFVGNSNTKSESFYGLYLLTKNTAAQNTMAIVVFATSLKIYVVFTGTMVGSRWEGLWSIHEGRHGGRWADSLRCLVLKKLYSWRWFIRIVLYSIQR